MKPTYSKIYKLVGVKSHVWTPEQLPCQETAITHSLFVAAAGSGEAYVDGRKNKLAPDTILFLNPGAVVDIHRLRSSIFKGTLLSFEIWDVEEARDNRQVLVKESGEFIRSGEALVEQPGDVCALAAQLAEAWERGRGEPDFQTDALFRTILHHLTSRLPETGDGDPERRIRQAVAYIHENYRLDITRDYLAQSCGLTPEYFSVLFKKTTGQTFADYFAQVRVAKAKEQLLLSKATLDQIAPVVGYSDGLYLSRKFKQVVGMSPSLYVKKPKTIVCLQYLGHLFALGLKPAGTTAKQLSAFATSLRAQGIQDIGFPVSLTKISELEPDLILTTRTKHEHFSQIATTVSLPWGQYDTLKELEYLGELLDRTDGAKAWIERFADKERKARRNTAGAVGPGETVAAYEIWGDRIWAVNIRFGRGTRNLYGTLGYSPPMQLAEHVLGKGPGMAIPFRELPQYAADHMFVSVWNEHGGEKRAREIMSSELWQGLDAVRKGRVYEVDINRFAWNDPLSLEQQLDIQTRLLTRKR
ncbi:helix-turn-helix domain-containing protein [Paenibacillus hodogayensis]|uniref:Helix-turn-helix domain-containing protein n=1 Tax=Paenibacillus hodogayensis TaxID=279208 RepID=A0ABV5W652_9BACL